MRLLACVSIVAGGLLSACSSDTTTAPEISGAQFFISSAWSGELTSYGSTGMLSSSIDLNQMGYYSASVIALNPDPGAVFPADARIPATVTTSAGDSEQVLLSQAICPGMHLCHRISVMLKEGSNIDALRRAIDSKGARVISASANGTSMVVFVFEPTDIPNVTAWLYSRNEVRSLQQSGFLVLAGSSSASDDGAGGSAVALTGGVRVSERSGAPTPSNNHLEVAPGDTITVTVAQPDGSSYSYQQVMGQWVDITTRVATGAGN